MALGRKNWLFSLPSAGAHATAAHYSLVESAKACDLNPVTYLQTLFERFPYAETDEQIKALLPCYIELATAQTN